jgi:hypothetical protein
MERGRMSVVRRVRAKSGMV